MLVTFPVSIKLLYEEDAIDAPYIAYIPEFDVSSCGKTEEEAKKNVKQALEITLEEVKKQKKLKEFLKEAEISQNKKFFPKISFEPFAFNI